MSRHDTLYLADILEAIDDIDDFLQDITESAFVLDKRTQAAVLQRLMLIGEAARQISPKIKERYPDVPWRQMTAFRNFAIHEYFAIDWEIVWVAATLDAPKLLEMVARVINDEV